MMELRAPQLEKSQLDTQNEPFLSETNHNFQWAKGYGNFWLDYDTGEVLIQGEYASQYYTPAIPLQNASGLYVRGYEPLTGQLTRQYTQPYPPAPGKGSGLMSNILAGRGGNICTVDPVNGNLEVRHFFSNAYKMQRTVFSPALKPLGELTTEVTGANVRKGTAWIDVQYSGPVCSQVGFDPWALGYGRNLVRHVWQPQPFDAPLYHFIWRQNQQAPNQQMRYLVSRTGPQAGLLLEWSALARGQVRVYSTD